MKNDGSPVIAGKKPKHEGLKVHKGGKTAGFAVVFSFVTFVYFVVKNDFHVKNGRAKMIFERFALEI